MRALQLLGYYLDCAFHGCSLDCRAALVNEPKESGEQKTLGCIHVAKTLVHRESAKAIAGAFGYWWSPCILCGKPYASFERSMDGLLVHPGTGHATCSRPVCVAKMRRLNSLRRDGWEAGTPYEAKEVLF